MKRNVYLLSLVAIMLLAFTACGGIGDASTYLNENDLNVSNQNAPSTEESGQAERTAPFTEDSGEAEQSAQSASNDDEGFSYQFDNLGFAVTLPLAWYGRYEFVENSFTIAGDGYGAFFYAGEASLGQWTRLELWIDQAAIVLNFFLLGYVLPDLDPAREWFGPDFDFIYLAQGQDYTYFVMVDLEYAEQHLGQVFEEEIAFVINSFRRFGSASTSNQDVSQLDYGAYNPFAEFLLEYFTGGTDDNTAAFWIDVDGNGTQGVLAIRNDKYGAEGRVFYLVDGRLMYMDMGMQDGEFLSLATIGGNRLVNSRDDVGSWSFTLFEIEGASRMLVPELTIGLMAEIPNTTIGQGKLFDLMDNARILTDDEYNEFIVQLGFDDLTAPWWDRVDETEVILATDFR